MIPYRGRRPSYHRPRPGPPIAGLLLVLGGLLVLLSAAVIAAWGG